MATFVATLRFTEKGIREVANTTKRATALKGAAKKLGVKVNTILWTLGAFDGLMVFEAADDETATALMLQLNALGNVQSVTTRAFTAPEMDKILAMKGS
jgi:uncharacterized protein with GYD domain